MARIIVSIILLCPAVALGFSMYKNKNNPNSVYAKALFRIKSVRVFPMISLVYAFFAVVILFFSLLIADKASGREQLFHDEIARFMMSFEKYNAGLDYPLMAIKGRQETNRKCPKILVLGDSFVWGQGLTNINQTWWSIMSSELERRGYDIQVSAAGFPGVNTSGELRWLRDTSLIKDIAPDLIILGYVANDHGKDIADECDVYDPIILNNYLWVMGELSSHRQPDAVFPNIIDRIGDKVVQKRADYSDIMVYKRTDYSLPYSPVTSEQAEYYSNDVLRPLGELIQELGIPLAVIPTPEVPREVFGEIYPVILPLFEKLGFPVYNPLDDFIKQYPTRNSPYFFASRLDPHPGPATAWFLGKYAADVLEQEYASVLGEKSAAEKMYPIEVNDWLPYMLDPQMIQESGSVSQYTIEYPDQSSVADFENHEHGNFLALPLNKKYVKLNFKYPVKLSSVKIEGENLLSAEARTLAINHKLGFDDQKPVSLGKRKGFSCVWEDESGRDVTSLLVSAKTADGKQAALTVIIEGEVVF